MRPNFQLILFTVASFFFISCNRNTVSLTETNARKEVGPLTNLRFTFSKALVPDSMLNRWDSTSYISFSPAIPGRFRWETNEQLIFSPAGPLAPATTYTASLRDDLLAYTNADKVKSPEPVSFFTAPLKLEDAGVTWVLPQGGNKAVPRLDLEFNYPISPSNLREKLSVTVDGQKQEPDFNTTSASRFISLQLNRVLPADKDYPVDIILEKGLIPDAGKNPTPEDIQASLQIPSPFVLLIRGVEAKHDGLSGTVKVLTSQQVSKEDLKTFVKINPATGFQIEAEDDGLLITGENFKPSETYDLKLLKGLRGILGGVLKEDYEEEIGFGELEPGISFGNSKGLYLMSSGEKNLDIRITNIPKVKLVISKIYASNLLAAHRYGYYPRDRRNSNDDEYEYDEEISSVEGVAGDIIYEKEIDTRSLPKKGEAFLLQFNPEDRLPDFKGIYHVMIRSATDYWIRDSRFVALSDIGLIAKESDNKLVVFANSLKTAAGLSGVQITAYGANNQVLGMATTDGEGVAQLEYERKAYPGFQPAMIIAKTADDFNYMPFSSTKVNTSRFDVNGKSVSASGMDAFIYGERDIYRPGEEIHAAAILRDKQWKNPGEIPVRFRLVMPNGKELKNLRKMLNSSGAAEISVPLPAEAYTGSYQLELYSGNDVLLGTKTISVEEFVPDRIKVDVLVNRPSLKPGDSATLELTALNLFGPPATNRNYEFEMQVKQKYFSSDTYDRYTFDLSNQDPFFDKTVKEGKTDEQGKARVGFSIPSAYRQSGLLQANMYTTVFDETGRPVSRNTTVDINTQDVYFGIGTDGYDYYALQQPVRFPLIALKKEGQPTQATARIQIIKQDYRTILNRSDRYFRYASQKEDRILKDEEVPVSGTQSFYSFTPRIPGNYEIRVFIPGATTYVSRSFYSYGSWGSDANAFEVNPEGSIDIETDKKIYQVGEKAKVLFKTPFSGRLLVTVESDGILSWQYVQVTNRSASVELPFQAQHLPNVYITATLFKPHGLSELPLTVAHGYQSVTVESKERKLDVKIKAVAASHSRTRQQITVQSAPGSMVTLAVVDEGILQVSGMKSPDPYSWFYQKRKLAVHSYDLYPLLFPELRAKLSSTGGDGVEMSKRTNPMPSGRIKLMSFWSGIKQTNGNGEAKFDVVIPGFSGALRLMAVAVKDEKFGGAETKMTIADPLVISTGLPRFLSPGDTLTLPVTLMNTTKNNLQGVVSLQLKGPLAIAGQTEQNVSISAAGEQRVNYRIFAKSMADTARIRVEFKGSGVSNYEDIPIGVRPSSTLQKNSGSGTVAGGKTDQIQIPLQRFLPGSTSYKLMIGSNPVAAVSDQLAYLIQYPYGCTEQTVSAAFPQIYFSDLSNLGKVAGKNANTAVANINEAIRKIKMRQLHNGAVTMWDESATEHWWATAYAAHFLTEASRAGYDVDKTLMEAMYQYLIFRLRNRQFITYYYNRTEQKKIAPKEVAYSLYVLALAGKPQQGTMNYYKSNSQWLSLDSRYTLAAGYALAGNKKSFSELLPSAFEGEESVTQTGGSFYSAVRDEALALSVLADTDPTNKQIPVMTKHVQDYLRQKKYLSTQERAFSFLALGKLSRNAAKGNISGEIRSNNKSVGTAGEKTIVLTEKNLGSSGNVEVVTKGTGVLYYSWEAEGVDATGAYVEEDSYIRVRRQFFDRNGKRINGNQFSANQLIIVGITLENSYTTPVDNIVITDLLPAGFEIENPRTKEIPGMDWIKDASSPEALDIRDDRIHFFVNLHEKKQTYYYAVRAVTPGIFKLGPVNADAMYNGEYHSYHGGGTVHVIQ